MSFSARFTIEMETKGSLPKYDGANTWLYFGDFVQFSDKPVLRLEMLQEYREVVGFP